MSSVRRLGSDSILHLERNFYWTDIKETNFYWKDIKEKKNFHWKDIKEKKTSIWTDIKEKRQRSFGIAILIDGKKTSSFEQKPQIAVGNYLLIFFI